MGARHLHLATPNHASGEFVELDDVLVRPGGKIRKGSTAAGAGHRGARSTVEEVNRFLSDTDRGVRNDGIGRCVCPDPGACDPIRTEEVSTRYDRAVVSPSLPVASLPAPGSGREKGRSRSLLAAVEAVAFDGDVSPVFAVTNAAT